jgi:hypothetical protein
METPERCIAGQVDARLRAWGGRIYEAEPLRTALPGIMTNLYRAQGTRPIKIDG